MHPFCRSAAVLTLVLGALVRLPGPALASPPAPPGSAGDSLSDLRTPAELNGFGRHTSHDEMMEYLVQVRSLATDMRLGVYGTTWEGRDLPYALFSRPAVATPAEAHASGKPVIVLGTNVHGFNHVLRESLLILMRDLAQPGTEMNRLLDGVIVLIVPSKNPDGLEAGIRFNGRGADLNRDYMALEQPAMAAYVGQIMNRWEPHLNVDGHDGGDVQYGGAFPYHLLYQAPGLAGADQALTALADERILPHLGRSLQEAGMEGFYWSRGDTERWYAGGSTPRIGRNYGGLANKLTILFEVTAWSGLEGGVDVGLVGLRSILTFARDHADDLVATVRAAREGTVALGATAGGTIPVAERMEADPVRVTYQVADPRREGELLRVEDAEILKRPVGTAFRDRPFAYLLPPEADGVVALLRRHGIVLEHLDREAAVPVRGYVASGMGWEEGVNLQAASLRVDIGNEFDDVRTVPRGSWVVPTGQVLGRVVAHLLEPETGDNVYRMGHLTHLLPLELMQGGSLGSGATTVELPILKIMAPVALPVTVR